MVDPIALIETLFLN